MKQEKKLNATIDMALLENHKIKQESIFEIQFVSLRTSKNRQVDL